MAPLRAHPWPGNVRELRNVVERMAIPAASESFSCESIPVEILLPNGNAVSSSLEEIRAQAERGEIHKVLEESNWNVAAAARALRIERTHPHKRIRALGLTKDRFRRGILLSDKGRALPVCVFRGRLRLICSFSAPYTAYAKAYKPPRRHPYVRLAVRVGSL